MDMDLLYKFNYNNNNSMQKKTHSLQRDSLLKLSFRESPHKTELLMVSSKMAMANCKLCTYSVRKN